ncbi:MAG: hypothetical protein AABX01_02730 [Candidatus Micrarchaeota archaeon]
MGCELDGQVQLYVPPPESMSVHDLSPPTLALTLKVVVALATSEH